MYETISDIAKLYRHSKYFYDDGKGHIGFRHDGRIVWWKYYGRGEGYRMSGSTDTPEGARHTINQ